MLRYLSIEPTSALEFARLFMQKKINFYMKKKMSEWKIPKQFFCITF